MPDTLGRGDDTLGVRDVGKCDQAALRETHARLLQLQQAVSSFRLARSCDPWTSQSTHVETTSALCGAYAAVHLLEHYCNSRALSAATLQCDRETVESIRSWRQALGECYLFVFTAANAIAQHVLQQRVVRRSDVHWVPPSGVRWSDDDAHAGVLRAVEAANKLIFEHARRAAHYDTSQHHRQQAPQASPVHPPAQPPHNPAMHEHVAAHCHVADEPATLGDHVADEPVADEPATSGDATFKDISEDGGDATSKDGGDAIAEDISKGGGDAIAEDISKGGGDAIAEDISKDGSDATSKGGGDAIAEDISKDGSDAIAEDISKDGSDATSKDGSDATSKGEKDSSVPSLAAHGLCADTAEQKQRDTPRRAKKTRRQLQLERDAAFENMRRELASFSAPKAVDAAAAERVRLLKHEKLRTARLKEHEYVVAVQRTREEECARAVEQHKLAAEQKRAADKAAKVRLKLKGDIISDEERRQKNLEQQKIKEAFDRTNATRKERVVSRNAAEARAKKLARQKEQRLRQEAEKAEKGGKPK